MNRLFKRAVALTVAKPKGFFTQQGNAIVIRELDVAFSIERTIRSEPNTCTATIYNLAETSRALLQQKPLHVTIEAGYDGETKQIFSGDLRFAESRHEGVDWETHLQLGDGERAYRYARVNRSFKPGVKVQDLLVETVKSMGLSLPKNIATAREMLTQLVSGEALQGQSHRELTRILSAQRMTWSVQDGRLQVLRRGEHRPEQAHVISQSKGLVGTPDYGPPPQKGEPRVLKVKTLIYPELIPGSLVKMDTRSIKGVFVVQRVLHTGDTSREDWYTEIEAVQPGRGTNGAQGYA